MAAFTHFADAEDDPDFTLRQDHVFVDAVDGLRRRWPGLLLHAANSAAALGLPETRHDLVRCGIAIYGYAPGGCRRRAELRPAMSFRARVTQVKTVRPGQSVGYGRTWVAERDTRVAAIAAGYADGVQRAQSNRGSVLVGGRRCPIIGRISMDQLTADVSLVDGVQAGRRGGPLRPPGGRLARRRRGRRRGRHHQLRGALRGVIPGAAPAGRGGGED